MKQLEVTQLWNKSQRQLRADEFQIPLLHIILLRWKRTKEMYLNDEISFNIEKALANKNTFIEFHILPKDFFGSLSVKLTHRLMLFSRNAPKIWDYLYF